MLILMTLACKGGDTDTGASSPTIRDLAVVVPGGGLPAEVVPQAANNNLDIVMHGGRMFLAFRTAPSHFASSETILYVVSTTDEQTWRYEGQLSMNTDLREPRFLSWDDRLFLYFAELGDNIADFEAKGVQVLGITCDRAFSLAAWKADQGFRFPLLSDGWPHGATATAYGCFNDALGAPCGSEGSAPRPG